MSAHEKPNEGEVPLDLGEIEPGEVAMWKSRDGGTEFRRDGKVAPAPATEFALSITVDRFREIAKMLTWGERGADHGFVDWPVHQEDAESMVAVVLDRLGIRVLDE